MKIGDWIERLEAVQVQLSEIPHGTPHGGVLRGLIPRMVLTRMQLQGRGAAASRDVAAIDDGGDATDSGDETAQLLRGYRLTVEVLLETCARLQQSWKLPDQFYADRLQMALLAELQVEETSEYLGPDLLQRVRGQLSDQAARDKGRRNAIAISWSRRSSTEVYQAFGIYSVLNGDEFSRESWELWSKLDVVASQLRQLVDAQPAERPALRQQMIEQFREFPMFSEQLPYLQNAEGEMQFLYADLSNFLGLGSASAWYGAWEQQAAEFAQSQ